MNFNIYIILTWRDNNLKLLNEHEGFKYGEKIR